MFGITVQVNPGEFSSLGDGITKIFSKQGPAGLAQGMVPTGCGFLLQVQFTYLIDRKCMCCFVPHVALGLFHSSNHVGFLFSIKFNVLFLSLFLKIEHGPTSLRGG